ncbi:MAG: RnfABCDGE type electron transport complex subunit D [Betaproteobacteria bacterium]|nr:RnfABCDGE type electron transport complex subunit D [Betaproteobacteria bacterium]
MLSSPYVTAQNSVSVIMLKVAFALLPAIIVYAWLYGPAIIISLCIATVTALSMEAIAMTLRKRPAGAALLDGSALITAWLFALSIPAIAPWWLTVTGLFFAIIVAKHLYGGLGNNVFNPAMVGYAVLIVSFPVPMTHWAAPLSLAGESLGWSAAAHYIFSNHLPDGWTLDAITSATPLDTLRTQLKLHHTIAKIEQLPMFGYLGGRANEMVVGAYLLGGLYLLKERIITWHIPVALLGSLALISGVFWLINPSEYASPWFHIATGGSLLGAFFIATDPVTAATTPRGKLIYAAGIGLLIYLIRMFGAYPDGVAFGVLLMNIAVPLIDAWTQPPPYGHKEVRT